MRLNLEAILGKMVAMKHCKLGPAYIAIDNNFVFGVILNYTD